MKNQGIKILFGIIIFLFSVALAYFTAWHFGGQRSFWGAPVYPVYPLGPADSPVQYNGLDAFWTTLLIFGGAYILIGISVARIFPISLGFLFSADVTLLHALSDQYHGLDNGVKSLLIFFLLILLYLFAAFHLDRIKYSYGNKDHILEITGE